ncbi:MAG TPA: UvrD-helicase domain-containing protein [bacterium]|nr:UvrD-helicase domain-containing protein [bacterium]
MTGAMDKKESSTEWLMADLNDAQSQAVTKTDGPVLILAGAGSGKTRVLTYRIAWLIVNGLAEPREILAMTFTNKAAGEMRERVRKLVPEMLSGMWIGTFHSLFARLLRREAERLNYKSNFAIYDDDDQYTLIKTVLNELKIPVTDFPPKMISYKISGAKNAFVLPEQFAQLATTRQDQIIATIYTTYQRRLRENNAMDFDDLLIKPIELFQLFPLVLEYYQDRFRYILVDEYQDTNRAQYVALKMLAAGHRNLCVVGDDDQSIYRWRGAEIRNILDFENDYPDCTKFRLEQNYRSTRNILEVAHSVVRNNRQRHEKKLWTEKAAGELISLLEVEDDLEEARTVVNKLALEMRSNHMDFQDIAVLYRTNAQSRVLEEALRRENIPYIIVGGVKFYERKEVKDVIAYLRLLSNPADTISLRRIINYPARGIGETTLGRIEAYAQEKKISIFAATGQIQQIAGIAARTAEQVASFHALMNKYTSLRTEISPAELAASLVNELGILREFKQEGTIEALSRAENVRELLLAIAEFSSSAGDEASLDSFLENVALTTDLDNWDDRANAVTLMTLHSAKGLEFPVVFITGLEEGLFPISRSLADPPALEEERRLFYVGATRAKVKLYLAWARNRRKFGETSASIASRFLRELEPSLVQVESSYRASPARRQRASYRQREADPMPRYEDESQEVLEYRVGMRVMHPTFGKGTIMRLEPGSSAALKLRVLFDQAGERRLVLPYAKLEIL